jgi:hypothetical protein
VNRVYGPRRASITVAVLSNRDGGSEVQRVAISLLDTAEHHGFDAG